MTSQGARIKMANGSKILFEGFYVIFVIISFNKQFIQHSQSSSVVVEVSGENFANNDADFSNIQASNNELICSSNGNCSKSSLSSEATSTLTTTPTLSSARNNQINQASNFLQSNHKFTQDEPTDKLGHQYIEQQQEPANATISLSRNNLTGTDSYSKTIYSSLMKILHHMKQQIDKNQNRTKDRSAEDDDNNNVDLNEIKESINSRQDDSHDLSQSVVFDDGPTMKDTDPYLATNELLSPFPSTTNTKVAGSENNSASKYAGGFSSQLVEDPNNQSATSSFKPMVTMEIQGDPSKQSNGNYINAAVAMNSPDNLKVRKSTFSNQNYQSAVANNAIRDNMKGNYVVGPEQQMNNQQAQQQQQQQPPLPQPQQSSPLFDSSPSPQSWSLTDKPANLLPSEDEPNVSSKPIFDVTPADYNLNSYGPLYDVPMETTNGIGLFNGQTLDYKQRKLIQNDISQQQVPIGEHADEQGLDVAPQQAIKIKSRRSRRSKTSTKPPIPTPEKTGARYMRATDFLSASKDIMSSNDPMDDEGGGGGGSRIGKFANQFNEIQDSSNLFSQTPRQDHTNVHLQQVYPLPFSPHQSYSQSQPRVQQQQQAVYTLSAAPSSLNLKSFVNSHSNNQMSSSIPSPSHDLPTAGAASHQQRDLVNQPQTIQITAVPNVGVNQPLVRVNGQPLFNNLLNNGLYGNGFLDPFGRQVVMVNAERRQIDWSYWFWPILLAVTLPLVLGALFVPVFLKTIVMLIQVLQSLGLLLPLTNALTQQIAKASGVSASNQVEQVKT